MRYVLRWTLLLLISGIILVYVNTQILQHKVIKLGQTQEQKYLEWERSINDTKSN